MQIRYLVEPTADNVDLPLPLGVVSSNRAGYWISTALRSDTVNARLLCFTSPTPSE